MLSVDSIKDGIVALVDENENVITKSASLFEKNIKEGDIVYFDGEKYKVDKQKTDTEKQEILQLLKDIGAL